ncbi:paeninodin family lasso peptide [Paenibacillus sp. JX-17]|uniref:Paeninodin family lasso peptide n=1 Tax=Paenibacillus lacisoli TaxID=3064525 RepID=A0ABT9CD69_9BACL|nr:paeninodin family lasso peptide [Paenibacillus sp. JX-17]MDO7907220.1 paeninodin family lasso peptide [Paenibacillus sp. JX-17]
MQKKEWQAPELEVLEVSQTMAGKGYHQIDWISEHDADMYDPS